ncbi:MAG: sigma-70 family RNA polymerase sigma factor [Deltaproteobacteria bacterium]|nr:sigma-70 family RNA polymerase sigma factor [Deltaproteobacteria bacterium]
MTKTDRDRAARAFEAERSRLIGVADRMLGSRAEADDVIQEAWIRLERTDLATIDNLGGWLTTVVARLCLDQLRVRRQRGEDSHEAPDRVDAGASPDRGVMLAAAVGEAMHVVLDMLDPLERVAFVLHDVLGLPFDQIAPIVDRTVLATRQLASRARRRVQGTTSSGASAQAEVIAAYLIAARTGDLAGLLRVLDPDIVVRSDEAAIAMGAPRELRGAEAVVGTFLGRAQGAQAITMDALPGAAWIVDGTLRTAFEIVVRDGRIVSIELLADRATLDAMRITIG